MASSQSWDAVWNPQKLVLPGSCCPVHREAHGFCLPDAATPHREPVFF